MRQLLQQGDTDTYILHIHLYLRLWGFLLRQKELISIKSIQYILEYFCQSTQRLYLSKRSIDILTLVFAKAC